ncbi:hypothetical protein B566_EDAN016396 [Ephemera danica]|nr:hypothetical protein B566_EDAN016396 [Ephemera danica]
MLLLCMLLTCGVALGAKTESSPPPGDPLPAAPIAPRETRSGLNREWPEPEWRSRPVNQQAAAAPQRSFRFTGVDSGFQPSPNVELARDYRFEPYYRQELSPYDRSRDRDIYDSPRYMDFNRPAVPVAPPRRIIYYDDLSNRNKGPSSYYYPQPQASNNYEQYRGGYNAPVRSPNIGVAPYRYPEQGRNYNYNSNGYNSILSEGTVENAPLVDDPYRNYNPRQPAPWSVQVGTSLTVKDDGRHSSGAARRFYVQSQREEPSLARSLGYVRPQSYNDRPLSYNDRPQSFAPSDRLWSALQPRV